MSVFFEEALKDACAAGQIIRESIDNTRAHETAMYHLECAQLWAAKDKEEGER